MLARTLRTGTVAAVTAIRRSIRRVIPLGARRAIRQALGLPPRTGATRSGPAGRPPAPRPHLRPGQPGGLTRLHVGCGPTSLMEGWWNVDIRDFPGVDEVADATARWPWSNLDSVYGEHFLEHLPLDGAMHFAAEAARALRPGGAIRLSTPCLEHVWATNFRPDRTRDAAAAVAETYRINRSFHGWGHEFLWSKEMLERVLGAAGFTDITFNAYGESADEALRGLESHPGWEIVDGWPTVWIVEARATGQAPAIDDLLAEIEAEFARYARSGH